ncbi:hypothetical protein CEXT_333941 [Caerostris extrusa]|uniref:Uncharacterized protein n=1 Tax=Caerostris extrusa TaxID=172846 RepID=A0AAV4XZW1_CAEEX|nr:hypothetical protein CEXT_333941 [Caerostris extrusa]
MVIHKQTNCISKEARALPRVCLFSVCCSPCSICNLQRDYGRYSPLSLISASQVRLSCDMMSRLHSASEPPAQPGHELKLFELRPTSRHISTLTLRPEAEAARQLPGCFLIRFPCQWCRFAWWRHPTYPLGYTALSHSSLGSPRCRLFTAGASPRGEPLGTNARAFHPC